MFRKLFRLSGRDRAGELASTLAPHCSDVEFVLVLVEAPVSRQLEQTMRGVIASALDHGGVVLQILGSLILVGFSGVIGCAPISRREAFVKHLCSTYKLFVRVVHGRAPALVGMVGCNTRLAYTAIPEHFASILEQFSRLSPGEAGEHRI